MLERDENLIQLPDHAYEGRALEAVLAGDWAISREGLEMVATIAARGSTLDPEAISKLQADRRPNDTLVRDGVGLVSVHGPIFRKANLFTRYSGATSLEIVARDLGKLDDDESVHHVVIDYSTPGGMVEGASETAEIIANMDTPTTAFVSGAAASAGYWLAAAADEIVTADTGLLGSIGVLATFRIDHNDRAIRIVSSQSPDKLLDPETDEGRAKVQQHVDEVAAVFVAALAKYRGVDEEKVLADFGQGGVLVGQRAVDAGMADRVGTLETLIAERVGGSSTRRSLGFMNLTAKKVTDDHPEVASELRAQGASTLRSAICTAMGLAADTGEEAVLESLRRAKGDQTKAVADARVAAATAERERIQGVLEAALPGHEALANKLAFDGTTTPGDAAMQINKAQRETPAKPPAPPKSPEQSALDAQRAGSAAASNVETVPGDQTPPEGDQPAGTLEEQAEAKWNADADLRASYHDNKTTFLAVVKNEGLARATA